MLAPFSEEAKGEKNVQDVSSQVSFVSDTFYDSASTISIQQDQQRDEIVIAAQNPHAQIIKENSVDCNYQPIFVNQSHDFEHNDTEKIQLNIKSIALEWLPFLDYCEEHGIEEEYMPYLRHSSAQIFDKRPIPECIIRMPSDVEYNQIAKIRPLVEQNLWEFIKEECARNEELAHFITDLELYEKSLQIHYNTSVQKRRSLVQMMEEMQTHPQIVMLQKEFGASLLGCRDVGKK